MGKRKATADFTEEAMPAASGGSRPRFDLLLEAQKNVRRLEAEELALSEAKVAFYKRALGDAERNVEVVLGLVSWG